MKSSKNPKKTRVAEQATSCGKPAKPVKPSKPEKPTKPEKPATAAKPAKSAKLAKSAANSATIGIEEKLWLAADKLRGSMDPSEYKHVVLGLLFL